VVAASADAAARAEATRWVDELRSARLSAGYPRDRLADALGVGVATVRSWESGRRIPSLVNLIKLGRELGQQLVIVGRNGSVRPVRTAVRPGEVWEHREIRSLIAVLRGVRHDAGITQDELGAAVGVSAWSIAQFERGRLYPRPAVLAALIVALACEARWHAVV
jgi:transcriptional regulator with XRE-family HTH domain